jgi:hypothetical protein
VFWPLQLNSKFSGVSEDSQVPISGVWMSSSHSFKVGLRHFYSFSLNCMGIAKIQAFIIEWSWHLRSTSQVEGHTYFLSSMVKLWSFNKFVLSNHFARYDWVHVPTLQANLLPTLTHPIFFFVIWNAIGGFVFKGLWL